MTNLLLDTNVFLWYFWGSRKVDSINELIISSETNVFISAVTWWEIAIKVRIGKLTLDLDQLHSYAAMYAFDELPMTSKYMKTYLELPDLHKDPFDMMLLAQAISSPMRLLTGDALLAEYSSLVLLI